MVIVSSKMRETVMVAERDESVAKGEKISQVFWPGGQFN